MSLGIGKEKLLPVDSIVGDRALALRGEDPVYERLSHGALYQRMPTRVDEDDAVLIEEPRISLEHDTEVAAILEGQPGPAIGQDVRVHPGGAIQRRPHPLPGVAIPRAFLRADVDPGRFPDFELREM